MIKVNSWVLYRFQWYIVELIDVDTGELHLLGDDGESRVCSPNQVEMHGCL